MQSNPQFRQFMISIHTPHAGSDDKDAQAHMITDVFQSTLPMRGATWQAIVYSFLVAHFNPHSPCGERLGIKDGD